MSLQVRRATLSVRQGAPRRARRRGGGSTPTPPGLCPGTDPAHRRGAAMTPLRRRRTRVAPATVSDESIPNLPVGPVRSRCLPQPRGSPIAGARSHGTGLPTGGVKSSQARAACVRCCPLVSAVYRWLPRSGSGPDQPVALGNDADVTSSMSAVGKLEAPSANEPPLLHTIEEAAEVLRIGRTLAYALARRYEDDRRSRRAPGHPPRQLPAGAALGAARARVNGRTVPLGELTPGGGDARPCARRRADAHQPARPRADPEPEQNAPRIVQLSGRARVRRAVRPRSGEQLHLLPPS